MNTTPFSSALCRALFLMTSITAATHAQPEPLADIAPWINRQLREHSRCVIPPGAYYLDSPIVFPYRSGVQLIGAGSCDRIFHDHPLVGRATRLLYRGPADEPAVLLTGSRFRVEGFHLLGGDPREYRKNKELKPRGMGVLLTMRQRGLGSGGGWVRDVDFSHFQTGLQFGEAHSTSNCDTTRWDRLRFSHCDVAIRSRNTMAMEHSFIEPRFGWCKRALVVDGGGMHTLVRPFSIGGVLLTLTEDNPPLSRPGPANGQFVIEDLKVDGQHRGAFVLLENEVTGRSHAEVFVVRGKVSGNKPWTFLKGRKPKKLRVEDFSPATKPIDWGKVGKEVDKK